MRFALVAMLLIACQRESRVLADSPRVMAPDSAAIIHPPSAINQTKGCPVTGAWSSCAVVDRLDRAGLVPRLDSSVVTEPPLTAPGLLVRLGAAELELYVYPDATVREREASKLDRTKYLAYDAPQGMRPQPTLIQSSNLIAILHSRNDHQRERVADAITAGPPQPAQPARP